MPHIDSIETAKHTSIIFHELDMHELGKCTSESMGWDSTLCIKHFISFLAHNIGAAKASIRYFL